MGWTLLYKYHPDKPILDRIHTYKASHIVSTNAVVNDLLDEKGDALPFLSKIYPKDVDNLEWMHAIRKAATMGITPNIVEVHESLTSRRFIFDKVDFLAPFEEYDNTTLKPQLEMKIQLLYKLNIRPDSIKWNNIMVKNKNHVMIFGLKKARFPVKTPKEMRIKYPSQ